MKRQKAKQFKSLNPYHGENKIEPTPRRHLNFKSLANEFDEIPFVLDGNLLFTLTTKFDIKEYNRIFDTYQDKEYPIILKNGNYIYDEKRQDVARNFNDEETQLYNILMNKLRTVELLRLCCNLEIPDSNEEAIQYLDYLGTEVYQKVNKAIQEIVLHKHDGLKSRKHSMAREILAFTAGEKLDNNIKLKELGKYTLQNKKGEPEDGRKTDIGITREYLVLSLAEKYNWEMDYIIKVLKNDLTEDEECVIELMMAKYELDNETETRIHEGIKNTPNK